ncbi:MAG: phage minor head protein [Planctomycetota bacterium]|jgi:hypothetical protein
MPDLPTRKKHEEELAALLLTVFDDWHDRWQEFQSLEGVEPELAGVLLIPLAGVHEEAGGQLAGQVGYDPQGDWLSQKSAGWAGARVKELSQQMVATSKEMLGEGASPGEVFSKERADMVAITEITRSITMGELAILLVLAQEQNRIFLTFWYTQLDERVCPVCAPLHSTERAFWQLAIPGGPPAHPHCRCYLTMEETSENV